MGILSGNFVCLLLCCYGLVCPCTCGERGDACTLHPFTKSHSHNDGQTLALHFLSSFHSLEAGQTDLELPNLYVLYSLVEKLEISPVVSSYAAGIYLRAPPIR